MNWAIKEATVKPYHHDTPAQLKTHLTDFTTAYNYARRLKMLQCQRPSQSGQSLPKQEPDSHGARAVLRRLVRQETPLGCWTRDLLA